MQNITRFFTLLVILCMLPILSHAGDGKLRDSQTLRLAVEDIELLDIDAGAGPMLITGDDQLDEIIVEAKIYQDKADEDGYELSLERMSGSRARLVAKNKRNGWWGWNETWIDLTIRVPARLNIDIDDGSGPIEVIDILGELDIDDGSGEIRIENISGDVLIDDGSGPIRARELGGDIRIDDGSGEIDIKNVAGTVTIDDGSGDIDVDGAANFILDSDGSGGVDVDNVAGEIDMGS